MYYTADPRDRAGFIASLRELADFLTANPAVAVPRYGAGITLTADRYENGGKEQVDHIARLLDAPVTDDTPEGHYVTYRIFGCVSYEAVAISSIYTARRDAQRSYEDSITLDTSQEADTNAWHDEDPDDYDDYDPGPECDDQGGMSEYRTVTADGGDPS